MLILSPTHRMNVVEKDKSVIRDLLHAWHKKKNIKCPTCKTKTCVFQYDGTPYFSSVLVKYEIVLIHHSPCPSSIGNCGKGLFFCLVWDSFGTDWSVSWKWLVNLSDSKLYIAAKILSLWEKNHFTTYIYAWHNFNNLRAKKPMQNSASWKLPWIHPYFGCHSPILNTIEWFHHVKNTDVIYILLLIKQSHTKRQLLTCFYVLVIYITTWRTYPWTTTGEKKHRCYKY
jgi:hypothetical protein